jgi:EsV-1-7 cysteine-rich motif
MESRIQKCQGCRRELPTEAFIRGSKSYKRCETCRQKRIKNVGDKQICLFPNCGIRALFNFRGESRGVRCSKHKEIGMTDIKSKKCASIGCGKRPAFNFAGELPKFCATHQLIGMTNVKNKKCEHENCSRQPIFNFEGEKKGKFCAQHKSANMINVRDKKCSYKNEICSKKPMFNFEGESEGKFCSKHKEPTMVNVISRKCAHTGCKFIPTFNVEGERKGKFCVNHKEPMMVDVRSKKCVYDGCTKRSLFNFEGEKQAKFCKEHKDDKMIDIKSKRCEHPLCNKKPVFNFEGEKKGKFCVDHKQSKMVDVKNRKCEQCNKRPIFNFEGSSHGAFCLDHKSVDMVDVVNKKCSFPGCKTQRVYGIPGSKPSMCSKHRTEGMCKHPSTLCNADDCKEKAFYGIDRPLHCEEHREDLEQNLCLRRCKNCSHLEICNNDGLCFEYCINSDLFKRSKHQKEIRVQNLLKREIQEQPYSCDKIIDSSCNKKRPDILYDCRTHFLAIEIDEHQHSSYQSQCEISRMKEICQAVGMPTIFIRYNPDNYIDSQSNKSKIPKAKREQILVEWVRHCIGSLPNLPDEFLRVIYLFYDGFDPTKSSLDIIKM